MLIVVKQKKALEVLSGQNKSLFRFQCFYCSFSLLVRLFWLLESGQVVHLEKAMELDKHLFAWIILQPSAHRKGEFI